MPEQSQQIKTKSNGPEFAIQRLYIKDLSFEAPYSPHIFLEEWNPELNMDLATKVNDLGENNHEVILIVTITVTMRKKTVFLVEVQHGGIFTIKNFPREEIRPILGSFCPNILYPYAREVITDVVVRGGFPQLYLSPVNFDDLFEQHEHSESESAEIAYLTKHGTKTSY